MPPSFTIESGKTGTVAVGGLFENTVTPTVFPDGKIFVYAFTM